MKSPWSHAGGVVRRTVDLSRRSDIVAKAGDELEYLLVEASENRGVWVLPKGHIEKDETPEAAAVREVMEEAGVRATIVDRVGEIEFDVRGRAVRVIFFLMQYQEDIARTEVRGLAWRGYEEALALLHFDSTRRILMQAHALTVKSQ